jgi:hypothetical protein
VTIVTPLLARPLEGGVFLGKPRCGPCSPEDAQDGRLLPLLLQAQSSGVTVSVHGSVSVNQGTGQLTASFHEAPRLPFEDLAITLGGGPRAPLTNPSVCGVPLMGLTQLVPYSGPAVESASVPFRLAECQAPRFRPAFVAGTTDNRASRMTTFRMTFSRSDADEAFTGVTVRLAPGLTARLAAVGPCPEPLARAAQCSVQSEIGSITIAVGLGSEPYYVRGRVYLTGPYGGGPFGLSIVVPVTAGPLNLGTLNVRAVIEVNPTTAALTIRSDPWPQSIDGIPLQLKMVHVAIDRDGLVVNPTSCDRTAVMATLASAQGAMVTVSSPFQAARCESLHFAPKLTVLTHAYATKMFGAYLHPQQLAPRLTALREACPGAVFEADPKDCPASAGRAVVTTPLLREALSGNVYVVSWGASATPELGIVLRGEGVALRLVGQVSVKRGIVALAFRSLPDVPVSTIDLVLPSGRNSLLVPKHQVSLRAMCRRRLILRVAIAAQNGATLAQHTPIAVSGCRRRAT